MFAVVKRLQIWAYLLLVTDCADCLYGVGEDKLYGETFSFRLPSNAYFLEYTNSRKVRDGESVCIWDRTDPGVKGRGRTQGNQWIIENVTQSDAGQYRLNDQNQRGIYIYHLSVSAWEDLLRKTEGEDLVLQFQVIVDPYQVKFNDGIRRPLNLMRNGSLSSVGFGVFGRRLSQLNDPSDPAVRLLIQDLKEHDSGFFTLYDKHQNSVSEVHLTVLPHDPLHGVGIAAVAVGLLLMVVLCIFCVRRYGCKKRSSKRESSVPAPHTAAAPTVHYHDDGSQPSGPSHPTPSNVPGPSSSTPPYVDTHEPTSLTAKEPPPAYEECISSNPGPQFELRGVTFPSAPPLSSDSTHSDVYTSHKLNFL